jgi:nucleotide-binding universal stress UspA family protein
LTLIKAVGSGFARLPSSCPTDGSPLAFKAVERAVEFARDIAATVVFLTVVEPFHIISIESEQLTSTRDSYERLADMQAAQFLAEAEMKARERDVTCHTVSVESDNVHLAIIDTAIAHSCDLIAIASHGRSGVSALVLGSVTAKVLSHSQIPVLVYR